MTPDQPENGLGKAIAVQRVHLGMKRKDLADASDLSYPYISEIENGAKQPSTKALRKIAEALEVSVGELHGRADTYSEAPSLVLGASAAPAPALRYATPENLTPLPSAARRADEVAADEVAAGVAGQSGGDDLADVVRNAVRSELDGWAREELPAIVRRELQRALAEIAAPRDASS